MGLGNIIKEALSGHRVNLDLEGDVHKVNQQQGDYYRGPAELAPDHLISSVRGTGPRGSLIVVTGTLERRVDTSVTETHITLRGVSLSMTPMRPIDPNQNQDGQPNVVDVTARQTASSGGSIFDRIAAKLGGGSS